MKTTLGLKNFRIFDEKGASVHINPLTILTGCNSSGKSSIVKALILLNEFLKGVRESAPGSEPRLKFDRKPLSLLGNFDSIVNKDAQDKRVTISYTVDSLYLGNGTTVEMTFGTQDNDIRKDGFLKKVAIKDANGNLLYHGTGYQGIKRFFPSANTSELPGLSHFLNGQYPEDATTIVPLKARYFAYHLICHALDRFNRARSDHEFTGETTSEEVEEVAHKLVDFFHEIAEKTNKDLVLHAVDCYSKKRFSGGFGDMFKTDGEYVERAMQADIISYLPVLDVLDSISKEEFEEKFRSMCVIEGLKTDDRYYLYRKGLVDSIAQDFTQGDFQVFSDYYRSIENAFLEEGRMMVRSSGSTARQLAISDEEVYKHMFESDESFTLVDDILVPTSNKKTTVDDFDFKGKVSLEQLFYLLTSIKGRPSDDDYIICINDAITGEESRDHRILRDYMAFRKSAIKDIFTIDACDSLRYVGSNRIEIKRLYSLENQDNFARTVSEYFEATRLQKKKKEEHMPGDFINRWLQNFGIGQRFSIESLPDGIGLILKIYQREDDANGRILADFGYGISQLVSILLEIETAILKVRQVSDSRVIDYEKQTIDLSKLFFVEGERNIPICIAIEEPEIHLHPRYQSLLADMFVGAYFNYGIHFIVETHSEYLIRKLQNLVARGSIKPDALSILYVEDGNDSDEKVREIGIAEDGRLTSAFGPGFFDEADSLAMNLLKIKGGLL
ncbi:MAG: AAA family ATPase [Spirochaetales bacterium]|nr:AAA family ATPase [Spirochaetales bacterium]